MGSKVTIMCNQTTEQLSVRTTALKHHRTRQRMHSFCLPKENTIALLDYHCDDEEPENDTHVVPAEPQLKSQPLNRRKMSLRRNKKQRLTSFRLDAEKTQQLLLFVAANCNTC